jgi:HD-GYP domain-containing protein (c-di-GMP phosphodiesterase class II)
MSELIRLLIVDDSEDDALLLVRQIKQGGSDPTFLRVDSAKAMKDALTKQPWDIIFSDYNMPHFNTSEALDIYNQSRLDLPFIIVSGAVGEETAVELMKAGAHDFIKKNNLARLIPAIERELRDAEVRRERKKVQEKLDYSFVDLAETVSRAMDSRDPYTAGHQRRVARLARLLGERMGLDKYRLLGLYIGGLLHDIGKISIPESILSKPGKLTVEEWNLLRTHPQRGYEILKDTALPWPIADIALHHHERLDQSGYPHGIGGNELSLENRILSICDVVEAMSSFRPYRPARSKDVILAEVIDGRGIKYDPGIADIMLQILENDDGTLHFLQNEENVKF